MGGPVWHASGRGSSRDGSLAIARRALEEVGDSSLGEWIEDGTVDTRVVHVRRRLSSREAGNRGIVVRDIRGTPEEERRLVLVAAELGLR